MTAWGRTGRVTVKRCGRFHDPEHDRTVRVDGKRTGGTVVKVNGSDDWFVEMFGPDGQSWSDNLPSRDAAVLWVLRRVDPALWRQERGEVVTVKRAVTLPSGCPSHYAWRFYGDSGGGIGYIHYSDFPTAVRAADRYARARYAEVLAS